MTTRNELLDALYHVRIQIAEIEQRERESAVGDRAALVVLQDQRERLQRKLDDLQGQLP